MQAKPFLSFNKWTSSLTTTTTTTIIRSIFTASPNPSNPSLPTPSHHPDAEPPLLPSPRMGGGSSSSSSSSLSSRIERLSNGESVVSAFQGWMGDGFPVHRGDVFHAINRLRKFKLNKRALEVMEWVIRERPYKLKELDYSYLLEFTTKIHGIPRGENLFTCIPSEFRNELLYNNLVLACLDKGAIALSKAYMKRMRELRFPISLYVFNHLIILHSFPGNRKSIHRILTQMKADGVSPQASTFNILLKIEASDHNIEGLMKVFNNMKHSKIDPNEITYCILATAHAIARLYTVSEVYVEEIVKSMSGDNWSTMDILLVLYGYLGKEKDLEHTWEAIKSLPHVRNKCYILAIEAFGRIGRVDRAEELWSNMKRKDSKLVEQFNSIISVYCRHGLINKASHLLKELEAKGCKPNAITYRHLALGYMKAGLQNEALRTLDVAKDYALSARIKSSTPWLETTYLMVEIFADMGDLENVKRLFGELKESKYCRYTFVCNTLLRAYVKAKVYEPGLLTEMIMGGARPDSETYSLVSLIEQYRT
ncbi:Pentatricopeptide repeat-containing protein [Acorus calamus]|uniref:Pentatricopeptide repeat-containing protein n=1 Tax=Acorus calamus TaxID=4465 RepID=A0AAV9CXZ4_ACOCL|nr:Pentatricopeptide repeat-containing protein [Acorus calamus]